MTAREALAASVDGRRLVTGGVGDVVLLDHDPWRSATTRQPPPLR
ncbi:MAG: hypothetical protein R2742_00205 [Micropruina glycogenica]